MVAPDEQFGFCLQRDDRGSGISRGGSSIPRSVGGRAESLIAGELPQGDDANGGASKPVSAMESASEWTALSRTNLDNVEGESSLEWTKFSRSM